MKKKVNERCLNKFYKIDYFHFTVGWLYISLFKLGYTFDEHKQSRKVQNLSSQAKPCHKS